MKREAKPQDCPFCGGDSKLIESCSIYGDGTIVQCVTNGCNFAGPLRDWENAAIRAWNSIRVRETTPTPRKRTPGHAPRRSEGGT